MSHVILAVWNWLLAVTGTHIPAGQYSNWYNFWSGFGADLTEFAILGAGVRFIRQHHKRSELRHKEMMKELRRGNGQK